MNILVIKMGCFSIKSNRLAIAILCIGARPIMVIKGKHYIPMGGKFTAMAAVEEARGGQTVTEDDWDHLSQSGGA